MSTNTAKAKPMSEDILKSLQVSPAKEIPIPSWCTNPASRVYRHDVVWYVHKKDYDNLGDDEPYKSPVFAVKNHRAWIEMYPQGDDEDYDGHETDEEPVSLFVQFEDNHFPVEGRVEFQLCSRRAEAPLGSNAYTDSFGWGFHRIWKGEDADVEFKIINCTLVIVVPPSPERHDAETQVDDLWKLSSDLVSLLENERFCDVTIKVGEAELKAHKNVLSTRSEVFAAMFQTDMTENRSNVIEIADVEVDVMKHLLRYVYSGRFERVVVEGFVERLMAAADKFGLQDLKKRCSKILTEKMSIFNVANLLVLADKYQDGELVKETFNFIQKNWLQVQESDAWRELRKVRGDLAFFVHSVVKE